MSFLATSASLPPRQVYIISVISPKVWICFLLSVLSTSQSQSSIFFFFKMFLKSVFATLAALPAVLCAVGNIVQITENFGPNPNAVMFYIYLPPNLQPNAPILVNPRAYSSSCLLITSKTPKYFVLFWLSELCDRRYISHEACRKTNLVQSKYAHNTRSIANIL